MKSRWSSQGCATRPGYCPDAIWADQFDNTANRDGHYATTDTESVATLHRLLREEGLFPGSASGVDVAGALRVGKELGPDHTVVTILYDSGHKHQSRLFNREWLASKGLGSAIGFG